MNDETKKQIDALSLLVKEVMDPFPMVRVDEDDQGNYRIHGSTRIVAERLYLRGVRRIDG